MPGVRDRSGRLTPTRIVEELDKYIIGQSAAKRAVAVSLRNRWRRLKVREPLRSEITPKNILMIGPTGVGKTEISRRLAKLVKAPFLKVEATKFTEVGYVGRDVDSIIRELVDIAIDQVRDEESKKVAVEAEDCAEERLADILLPNSRENKSMKETRKTMIERLHAGDYDDKMVEVDVKVTPQVDILPPPGMEEMASGFQNVLQSIGGSKTKKRKMRVKDAFWMFTDEETERLVDFNDVKNIALDLVEERGIVFLDEIDKITSHSDRAVDVSRHGVQRDLLPLIEGTAVSTKYGLVRTDHVLFIASGAFHMSKPSDLIPEFQGRFPIRVEMLPLTVEDFAQILSSTDACLVKQYVALFATEGIKLNIPQDTVESVARYAWEINDRTENIGARRLYTILEKLLERVSFEADRLVKAHGKNYEVTVTPEMVEKEFSSLSKNHELSRYVL